ncbi:kinase [Hirsutella rhossiliensis]|uniref:cyclin-dependent kinase n=1 Tax=Hirsutella rhossiliensis TaxID=111463 RepID=A0A9P8SJQ1_9HYPO|nr:kinase [Hirsutella rhossiliensis]KAH0965146.1 kinase [Hirsutella rhossiliensis]
MRDLLKPPRRRRHAAMKDVGGRDAHGERVREPRRSSASRPRHRHSTKPEHASNDARRSRDRSRHRSSDLVRRQSDADDLIPRYREGTLRRQQGTTWSRGTQGRGPRGQSNRPVQPYAPPRSPQSYREQRRREQSADPHFSSRSDFEDDMASRSSYRAGNNPLYAHKPYYGNEARNSDAHGYSQSPQRGGSYQNSPSMSPYGAHRGGWAGQYSPQQHPPPQYHHGSYGASNPPPEHFHSHHPHSPPHSAPSGPSQPYSHGGYRESYRGGSFRGASFSGRGGYRGSGPQNPHWGPAKPTSSLRGHDFPPDDTSRHQSAVGGSNDATRDPDAGAPAVEQNPKESTKASAVDVPESKQRDDAAAPSSSRPPASNSTTSQPGSSGKFSFSFKPSSKPTPTAPKLEISQKFNAVPQRKEAEQKTSRDRDPPMKKTLRRLKTRPILPSDLAASESVFFRKPGNESVVGSGTYGKVFKGLNVYTKGLVALKRIRMEGERDGFPVTAVREIKLLQSLRHTNIVNLEEVMVEKNDCFMVFEYLSHDLTGLLNHPSFKLDPAQRKHLAKQLFEGLDYLHTRGVLHRDIKAANILVSNEGVLKLADFGLARFYAKRHQLDYTNRVITIWYRSPELLLGETQYTAAVDVWSAACVMVEIFTRHAIFAGDGTELSQLEKIYNILGTPNRQDWPGLVDMAWFELLRPTVKRKSVFAEKYQDKVTPAAFDLLSSMFHYDPAKRPTAAEALQHAYFTTEEPLPRQAVELASIDGEWHEFESKALRKENERREREARRAAKDASREKDKKRGAEGQNRDRETKRVHMD